ncbi:unnamed protein product, partial [Closterium sp. NIES-54]
MRLGRARQSSAARPRGSALLGSYQGRSQQVRDWTNTVAVAVAASRGTPRSPFFEGCSPSPLIPSVATAAAVDLLGAEEVGAASASLIGAAAARARGVREVGVALAMVVAGVVVAGVEAVEVAPEVEVPHAAEIAPVTPLKKLSRVKATAMRPIRHPVWQQHRTRARSISNQTHEIRQGRFGAAKPPKLKRHNQYEGCNKTSGGGGRGGGGGGGGGGARGRAGKGGGSGGATRGGGGYGSGPQLPRLSDTPTPQQLCEWVVQHGSPGGSGRSTYVAEYGDEQEVPNWLGLIAKGVHVFALDFAAINKGLYAYSAAALGASESAAALGASASAATGASESAASESGASAEALHTFRLDSGASRCFFHDCTTVIPLAALVSVSLADPSGGPVVRQSTPALFQRVAICTCSQTGLHLATFTQQPGSSMYTLTTASAQVAASGQVVVLSKVSASGQLVASCSCRVLSHQTLCWHHRLGHPSLLRRRSMHSRLLRADPHSSFPSTTAPLQTLHMDVKADVRSVLIPWIHATRHQLRERIRRDLPVLRLHSDRGGEFSISLLAEFCQDEGIVQSFTLPASPQQNVIAECHIGLIMEVSRTSMIHVAAPHFLRPFAVRYAAHQLNLWPHVSLPETSPTLRWTGEVGDASAFGVWCALSLVRDTTERKLSPRTLRIAFLSFPTDAPPWQFYHTRSRRILSSQDVTFDDSVCLYRLHLHASHPVPLAPLFLVPVPPPVDPLVESHSTTVVSYTT